MPRAEIPVPHAFGWLVGTSPGAGLGLQYVVAGAAYCLACLIVPVVRNHEDRVPDDVADQQEDAPPPA